jgi:hypothetical protein
MTRIRFTAFVILSMICVGCVSAQPAVVEVWRQFLGAPVERNYASLVARISGSVSDCDWGSPVNEKVIPSTIRHELFDKVASGDDESFRVGVMVARCLDGGDLGDFFRSAGVYFEQRPLEFLETVRDAAVTEDTFESLLATLPESLVDDLDGQIRATANRVRILEQLVTVEYEDLRALGIGILRAQEQSLKFIAGRAAE